MKACVTWTLGDHKVDCDKVAHYLYVTLHQYQDPMTVSTLLLCWTLFIFSLFLSVSLFFLLSLSLSLINIFSYLFVFWFCFYIKEMASITSSILTGYYFEIILSFLYSSMFVTSRSKTHAFFLVFIYIYIYFLRCEEKLVRTYLIYSGKNSLSCKCFKY